MGLFPLCSSKKFKNILPSYPIFHAWVVCFVVLVTITTISIKFIKKVPYFAVGWFWYLGTLVPVIGIVQAGGAGYGRSIRLCTPQGHPLNIYKLLFYNKL